MITRHMFHNVKLVRSRIDIQRKTERLLTHGMIITWLLMVLCNAFLIMNCEIRKTIMNSANFIVDSTSECLITRYYI